MAMQRVVGSASHITTARPGVFQFLVLVMTACSAQYFDFVWGPEQTRTNRRHQLWADLLEGFQCDEKWAVCFENFVSFRVFTMICLFCCRFASHLSCQLPRYLYPTDYALPLGVGSSGSQVIIWFA